MDDRALIRLIVNKTEVAVEDGSTVAVAVLRTGVTGFRTSVEGQPRGPVCGMGICFECRVTIDGVAHQRSCNVIATDGMEVVTQ